MSTGANCFLASPYKDVVFAPNPSTERGKALNINAHPTLPLIIFPSGKYVIVKNLDKPEESFIYRGHASAATVAKFSPNGFWVASADIAGKVRVWSWDNPEHLTKLESTVFGGSILDLDWDMESKKIALVGEGSGTLVKCITWDTGNSVGEMMGHNKRVLSVSYKLSRPFRIMTGGEDMKSIFYAGPPFKLDHSNSCHTNFVNCVRYSPDGLKVISVGSDKKIQLYDGLTGQPLAEIVNAHDGGIYSVAFSPDNKNFLTASADKTVKLWDVETLTSLQTFTFSDAPQIGDAQLAVLWTATHMLSVSLNGNINILDRNNPTDPLKTIIAQQVAINSLYVDTKTMTLYSGSCDGVLCARQLVGDFNCVKLYGADKRSICGGIHTNKIVGIVAKEEFVWSAGWDDTLKSSTVGTTQNYLGDVALNGQPCCLASTHDSNLLLSVSLSEIALFRGLEKVASMSTSSINYIPTCGAIFSETEIAIGGSDFKTHVYAIEGLVFREVTEIATRSAVSALAYDPSGEFLAIGDEGRQVEVYQRGTWDARIKGKWVFHTSKVTTLAWSPTGNFLASGSLDENIFVWNLSKPNSKIQLAYAHMSGVTNVTWGSEEMLISAGNDHSIVTWKIPVEPC